MSKNPCFGCAKAGCGNHANCEKYMAFFNENRERNEEHRKNIVVAEYIKDPGDMLMRRKRGLH